MSAKRVWQDRTELPFSHNLAESLSPTVFAAITSEQAGVAYVLACFEHGRSVRIDQSDRGTALAPRVFLHGVADCRKAPLYDGFGLESIRHKAQGYCLQRRT
jgi:hypothetical protein